jgi:hypothetical protein
MHERKDVAFPRRLGNRRLGVHSTRETEPRVERFAGKGVEDTGSRSGHAQEKEFSSTPALPPGIHSSAHTSTWLGQSTDPRSAQLGGGGLVPPHLFTPSHTFFTSLMRREVEIVSVMTRKLDRVRVGLFAQFF